MMKFWTEKSSLINVKTRFRKKNEILIRIANLEIDFSLKFLGLFVYHFPNDLFVYQKGIKINE